jgi:hypothetical protein
VFDLIEALRAAPVRHHLANGSPPAYGVAGMGLLLICVVVLSAVLLLRRLTGRRQAPIGTRSSEVAAGQRR